MKKHPVSLHYFSLVHFFERFSFYGVQSLLVLHLVRNLNFSDDQSYAVVGVYGALIYMTPLLGGYIADKFIGFYSSIWYGLLFVIMGHITIYVSDMSVFMFYGLGLIVVGSGLYKSNMNALIGTLYHQKSPLKDSAYTIFFVYQSAGSLVAALTCGYLGLNVSWSYGFSLAALGGVLSFLLFSVGYKISRKVHSPKSLVHNFEIKKAILLLISGLGFAGVFGFSISMNEKSLPLFFWLSMGYLLLFLYRYKAANDKKRQALRVIFLGIIAVALSGALIGHGYTVFTLIMDRHIDRTFFQFTVPVTFIQSIDAATIVIFGPLIAYLLKRYRKTYLVFSQKLLIGFSCICVAYSALLYIFHDWQVEGYVSLMPFVTALVMLALSDIWIFPHVLSYCSQSVPAAEAGSMNGFIVFGMSLSQLFGSYFAKMASVTQTGDTLSAVESLWIYQDFFAKMTVISVVSLLGIYCYLRWLRIFPARS